MEWQDIQTQVAEGEGPRTEFKRGLGDQTAVGRTMCAFANSVGGVVIRDYAIPGSSILFEVFDRRVDITSPGALPNHMTVERVRAGAGPRSRNESMAHFLTAMGFMEQRGRGWLIMRREMRAFNGTEPDLMHDERNRFVKVTFRLDARARGRGAR